MKENNSALTSHSDSSGKKSTGWQHLRDVLNGNILAREGSIRQIPFLIFLGCIGLLYIANNYYAEDKIRQINKINAELKELRSDYITSKSRLMFISRQSELAAISEDMGVGIKSAIVPPKKIVINSNKAETKYQ